MSLPKTGSNVCALSCKRSATMHLSSPASRRSTKDAVSWRTGWRPRRLGRGPMISFGRATLAPRARAVRLGATQLRSALVFIRLARRDRLGHELRGAWSPAGDCGLHLVLPLLVHTRNPARSACPKVAKDHPLRRPLALARSKRRSTLPQIRRRHTRGQRQPATHLRRSARLRVEPLRPAAFTRRRATASCPTEAMAPVTAQTVNRSPRDRLLPVARPKPRPAAGLPGSRR